MDGSFQRHKEEEEKKLEMFVWKYALYSYA
jgi:hypothetical protein